jgi:hypothetical protein
LGLRKVGICNFKKGAYKYDKGILDKYSVKIIQPKKVKNCSGSLTKKDKRCRRNRDGRMFELPRKYSKKQCSRGVKGYSMKSSCSPFL